jgi:hypothetical protein
MPDQDGEIPAVYAAGGQPGCSLAGLAGRSIQPGRHGRRWREPAASPGSSSGHPEAPLAGGTTGQASGLASQIGVIARLSNHASDSQLLMPR